MEDRSRVYVIAHAESQLGDHVRLLQDAGYEVKWFASARDFAEFAPVVAAGCILEIRSQALEDHPSLTALTAQRADLPLIVMSRIEGDVTEAVETIKAGAADFLESSCSEERLLSAIAAALDAMGRADDQDREAGLTAVRIAEMSVREREVLEHLVAGGTNKTIAKELGISPRTVEIHRAHVMERLGAHNLSQAIRLALAAGLTSS
ncbi:MAG TPA: LuxR C-terminal-related transcriptional regulator [Caulobacteraceae bacterium]|jgi:FixJ family two-component response regulator